MTEYISSVGRPVAWLSLNEGDNDPALCTQYFIAALRKIKPNVGASALRLFRSSQESLAKTVMTDLINDICSLPEHFTLVLDDYHVIKNKSIHSALDFFIENLPSNMHLVIMTRSDPPLHLSHLRGRGQLTELRAIDLRFTLQEVTEFLNQIMKLNLSPEEISSLDSRSEGWIAGLQMAAISLKGRTNTVEFINAFSGSDRSIMDYLFEEVFERQTEDTQSFLLDTAVLDQLTGPLCDAVTGRNNSSTILDTLKRDNLFVLSLDNEGSWYRYHPLFADLLMHNLRQSKPQAMPELYERASLWYERNGLAAQAIEHALLGQNYSLAANLITRHAELTLMNGELATLRRWIRALPSDYTYANPILIVLQVLAEIWLHGGPLKREESQLQKAEEMDTQGLLTGPILAVRATLAAAQGETQRSVDLANRALEVLPAESTFWRSAAIPCLGQFSLLRGVLPPIPVAINLFNEAIQMGKKTGNLFTTVLALRRLAEAHIAGGNLREAQVCFQKIIDIAIDSQGNPLPLASFGMIGLGSLSRQWYELDKAANLLKQGIRLAREKLGSWQLEGYINLARVRNMQGDTAEANKLLQSARQLTAEAPDSKQFEIFVTTHEIVLSLRQGNLAVATGWAREQRLNCEKGPEYTGESDLKAVAGYYSYELVQITLARVYLAQNKPAEALKILEAVFRSAAKLERTGVLIEISMLEALAYKALNNPEKALGSLNYSLAQAEPEGYISLFIEEGDPMASLLYEAAQKKIMPEYTHLLLEVFHKLIPQTIQPDQHSRLGEPLSDRELNVLNLLAGGLSNKEIAHQLCIELRTVKWHTGNIFGKLNVKNRTQAVARARDLKIVTA